MSRDRWLDRDGFVGPDALGIHRSGAHANGLGRVLPAHEKNVPRARNEPGKRNRSGRASAGDRRARLTARGRRGVGRARYHERLPRAHAGRSCHGSRRVPASG